MERRTFLELAGLGVWGSLISSKLAAATDPGTWNSADLFNPSAGKAYGSGYFGEWIDDPFGMPAYRYTCNQIRDPKAVSPVDPIWRLPTDHTHQVGNDRLVAAVSNYGYVQVRQDEGSPKFLNDYYPEQHRYGGGIGFLADENTILSTFYSAGNKLFERIFGIGYLRKRVLSGKYEIDQVIFAPFGDDPVLISQVTITNHAAHAVAPRWVEYWGCHQYQFSYRALMESAVPKGEPAAPQLRRDFSGRFVHHIRLTNDGAGLIDTQRFPGRSVEEEAAWQKVQSGLERDPNGFYGGPVPSLARGAAFEDFTPPPTFVVSLDPGAVAATTNATNFFEGGIDNPKGLAASLDNDLSSSGPESAFFLERRLALDPGESKTLHFLYGYLPENSSLDTLTAKYAANPSSHWGRSSAQWKASGVRLSTDALPWVERETRWSSYYVRSGATYDSFFREHILSQGAPYQYIAGLQGAARDPLQHVLPMILTNPGLVREVIRYTLKEIQPDGSIPYGIVGAGVPMPCRYRPSDLEMWLLWVASEYVLATRDKEFLEERVPAYPGGEASPNDRTVRELLEQAYRHMTTTIGVGPHGLMRIGNGDWNDSIVVNRLSASQVAEVSRQGESVLNAAMACYVLSYYARLLDYLGNAPLADEARAKSQAQQQAVRKQWTGRWFRRAWLGETLGWSGEERLWLEPQPWAIIGGGADPEQVRTLVAAVNERSRKPSPIGALLQSEPDPTMKDEAGVGTNGGIFASINGTLIWALALVDKSLAWDEWRKNTLARHADVYPDMWFGIWSGPDAYNSILAKNPGGTGLEFPVMNMHPHAWSLYSALKLLGLDFHETGIGFDPELPLTQYEFSSDLLGIMKSAKGYSGWYAPAPAGSWDIELSLHEAIRAKIRSVRANGAPAHWIPTASGIRFRGESSPGTPLRWEIAFDS